MMKFVQFVQFVKYLNFHKFGYFMHQVGKVALVTLFGFALYMKSANFGHAQNALASKLGPSTVLSTINGTPTFEIALPQMLNADASIRLASPAAYAAKGLPYPLWLSDADMYIKRRPGQRQTISIQALRGNPSREAELMFEIDNNGQRYLAAHTMLFDNISAYAGQPMPPEPPASVGTVLPAYSQAAQTITPVDAKLANQPSSYSVASKQPYTQRSSAKKQLNASKAQTTPVATPAAAVSPSPSSTPLISPDATAAPGAAASSPMTEASVANTVPPAPMSAQQLAPKATPNDWLPKNWLTWTLGLLLALLFLYVLTRLIQSQRAKKARNAPLLTQETQFQTSGRAAANTVFGLSDTEAVAMQQQWVQQQISKKT